MNGWRFATFMYGNSFIMLGCIQCMPLNGATNSSVLNGFDKYPHKTPSPRPVRHSRVDENFA